MASRLQSQTLHPVSHGPGRRDDLRLGCRVRGRYVVHLERGYLRQIADDLLSLLAILSSREGLIRLLHFGREELSRGHGLLEAHHLVRLVADKPSSYAIVALLDGT